MGNKNQPKSDTALTLKSYKMIYSIQDQQYGEIKVYKNSSFQEFIAQKSFIFVFKEDFLLAIDQSESLKRFSLPYLIRLLEYKHSFQESLCNTTYNLELIFEFHQTKFINYFQITQTKSIQITEDSLKYLCYVLLYCLTYFIRLGKNNIDLSVNNIFLDLDMNYKYLEIETITKMTQYDRVLSGVDNEEICLSPDQMNALKNNQIKFNANEQTYCYNVGMIMLQIASLKSSQEFYDMTHKIIKDDVISQNLFCIEKHYSKTFIDFLKKLLSGTIDLNQASNHCSQWQGHQNNSKAFIKSSINSPILSQKQKQQASFSNFDSISSSPKFMSPRATQVTQETNRQQSIQKDFSDMKIRQEQLKHFHQKLHLYHTNQESHSIQHNEPQVKYLTQISEKKNSIAIVRTDQNFLSNPNQIHTSLNNHSPHRLIETKRLDQSPFQSHDKKSQDMDEIKKRAKFLIEVSRSTIKRLQEQRNINSKYISTNDVKITHRFQNDEYKFQTSG